MTLLALPALNGSLEKIPNACIVVSIDFFCFGKFSNEYENSEYEKREVLKIVISPIGLSRGIEKKSFIYCRVFLN